MYSRSPLPMAALCVVLVVAALLSRLAGAQAQPLPEPAPSASVYPDRAKVAPAVPVASVHRHERAPSTGSEAAPSRRLAPVLLETQDFESQQFPPPGWSVYDLAAREDGVADRYVFSREVPGDLPPERGQAVSWSVGGGALGSLLPYWSYYPEGTPVNSAIGYVLDSRPYPAGLQVQVHFNIDVPTAESFVVCASVSTQGTPDDCYRVDTTFTDGWYRFDPPLVFANGGNQEQALVYVLHDDSDPLGVYAGVLIDDVSIWGLTSAAEPTDTPPVGPTTAPPRRGPVYLPRLVKPAPPQAEVEPVSSDKSGMIATDDGHSLFVPPGAVPKYADGRNATVQFSIETSIPASQLPARPPGSIRLLSDVAKYGPDGFTFAAPLAVSLPLREPAGVEPYALLRYHAEKNRWLQQPYALSGSAVDGAIASSEYSLGYVAAGYPRSAGPLGTFLALPQPDANGTAGFVPRGLQQSGADKWRSGCFEFSSGYSAGSCPAGLGSGTKKCHYYLVVKAHTPKYPEISGNWGMTWANFRTGSQPDSSPSSRNTIFFAPQGTYEFCVIASEWAIPGGFLPLPGKWTYTKMFTVNLPQGCHNRTQSIDIASPITWAGVVRATVPSGGRWNEPPAECPGGSGAPTPTTPVGTGQFQATLSWVNTSARRTDLDLHLYGPNGIHVYYDAERSADGSIELDRDWRSEIGNAIENIYSLKAMPKGNYELAVQLFRGPAAQFNVRTVKGGAVATYNRSLSGEGSSTVIERFTIR